MQETLTAEQAHNKVREAADKPDTDLRVIKKIAVGEAVRQGDIYLKRVAKTAARGEEIETRQLAPGNTQGSRHCVEGDVKIYARKGDALTGPIVESETGFRVTHPEHAHFDMPAGTYAVTYQRDFAREEVSRVND